MEKLGPPPEYSSTVDLTFGAKKQESTPAITSTSPVPVTKSQKGKQRCVLKIVGVVFLIVAIAVLLALVIKFASDSGSKGSEEKKQLQPYLLIVRNATGNYEAWVAIEDEREIVTFKDTRRSSCFLYFPDEDADRLQHLLQEGDGDSGALTLTYTKNQTAGYRMALRVIPETISARVVEAAAGSRMAAFCSHHQAFFLKLVYGGPDSPSSTEREPAVNINIIMP